jgi:antitoxin component YwqK of YwqJK toxin-antitoxin module
MPSDVSQPPRVDYDDIELDDELALVGGTPFTGIVYSLHGNGSIECEGRYVDGLPDGLQEEWDADGRLVARSIAVRGNGSSESWTWYPGGRMRTHRRFRDRQVIEDHAWDEQGGVVDPASLPPANLLGVAR